MRKLVLLVLSTTTAAIAFSGGPPAGHTGAPGERTCVDCHDSFDINRGPGSVTLNLPKKYRQNERLSLELTARQQNRRRWGFQITALDTAGNAAGLFSISDAANTQLQTFNGRTYVQHTTEGSLGQSDSKIWRFDWIAPSVDQGRIRFYIAVNAADGDGTSVGDYIYTEVEQLGAPSDPQTTLIAPNGGEKLTAGQVFTVKWESENATSHDLLLQSDGPTSIPKMIVAGLGAEVTSYSWMVPNLDTTRARMIVVAHGQQGSSDSDSSDRDFSITVAPIPAGPSISTVKVNDKRIKAIGSNFKQGVVLQVSGKGFATPAKLNSEATVLTQRGQTTEGQTIAELIPVGAKVELKFINPDGGVTVLEYTRR
ncbi:MAG: choice-of-anchor V domain-containing protein [Acidobacteriota bacterium]|nr:hypothetical protein [Blastocatellia bacterium]MDW8413381.1 choice-of-anchor V domain-containing protein [Acidobacteriota bacterium]